MDDLIRRQAALDAIMGQPPEPHYPSWYAAQIKKLPAVQPDHNADIGKKAEGDCISRQAAIDALNTGFWGVEWDKALATAILKDLPPAQPEEAIPVSWIESRIERFKAEDNAFGGLTANIMHVMLNEWKREQEGETE